jgi:hypothetical protein
MAVDSAVRILEEALKVFGMPMVAAGLLAVAVHALLDNGPFPVISHEETVQVEIEAILDSGAVDLGNKPARARQQGAVKTDPLSQQP